MVHGFFENLCVRCGAHCSYEAGILEDPDTTPPSDMWKLTADPILSAPNEPEDIVIDFEKGMPVKLTSKSQKEAADPTGIFLTANALARKHGVDRIDIVENRFIGLKSRGCRPGRLDLDCEVRVLGDQFVTVNSSKFLYNGLEREFLEASIKES